MRIWILNHYALPLKSSGPNTHAVLAHYLHRLGHEVTLFPASIGWGHLPVCDVPDGRLSVDQFEDGVRYRFVRTRPYRTTSGRFLNMLSYRRNVCRVTDGLERPDVIVGSCVHPWAVDAAIRLSQRYEVPFVYQIRDIWPETLVEMKQLDRWHPLYWHLRRLELKAFRHAAAVTGVIPGIEKYARLHGIPADRVSYLPNGIDPAAHPSMGPPPNSGPFVVSYFGSHGPANSLTTVLDAAAELQERLGTDAVRFRFVGDGTEKPRLLRRAQKLRLRNVEFLDRVPKAELPKLAQQSHAFVFVLRRFPLIERYGLSANKLFDYLVGARPIVFACRSLNNPIDDVQAGLSVDCEDSAAMAEAVVRLRALTPQQREDMGIRGRQYALKHHDLSKLAVKWEEFLARATWTGIPGLRKVGAVRTQQPPESEPADTMAQAVGQPVPREKSHR